MKQFVFFISLLLSVFSYGQDKNIDSNCYVIQFINKQAEGTSVEIGPEYNPLGFYLLNNGVYDFIIDGKKYFQSLLLKIDKEGFEISRNWESSISDDKIHDTMRFSINQNIQIRLVWINNGVGGLPSRTKLTDYKVSIVPTDKYCLLKDVKMKDKDQEYIGHFYFTAYGLKEIRMVKGKPYLVETNGEFILRRN